MENRDSRDIGRILGLFSDLSASRGVLPVSKEHLTNHRRGQRFKSSTAHLLYLLQRKFKATET